MERKGRHTNARFGFSVGPGCGPQAALVIQCERGEGPLGAGCVCCARRRALNFGSCPESPGGCVSRFLASFWGGLPVRDLYFNLPQQRYVLLRLVLLQRHTLQSEFSLPLIQKTAVRQVVAKCFVRSLAGGVNALTSDWSWLLTELWKMPPDAS
jgi:hypothetical protein